MSSQLWKLWHASGARTSACARGIPCTVVSCPSYTYAHGTLHSFTGFEDLKPQLSLLWLLMAYSTVLLIHCSNTEIWFLATDYNAQLGRESWTTHTIHQWWLPSTSMTCEVLVSTLLKCLLSDYWLVCTAGWYLVYHTAVTPPADFHKGI